jgi:LAGLIDADG endonuclease
MVNKEHLNIDGLPKIIAIKASMNIGLSEIIISNFNKVNPVKRPIILTDKIPDSNWVAGFTTGEGNFDINIYKSKDVKIGHRVQLRIRI